MTISGAVRRSRKSQSTEPPVRYIRKNCGSFPRKSLGGGIVHVHETTNGDARDRASYIARNNGYKSTTIKDRRISFLAYSSVKISECLKLFNIPQSFISRSTRSYRHLSYYSSHRHLIPHRRTDLKNIN